LARGATRVVAMVERFGLICIEVWMVRRPVAGAAIA
jgi:hypothetical protein